MKTMKHYYQTHVVGCVQAAGAIFLSAYDIAKSPTEIEKEVPMRAWPGKNELAGTPNQDMAAYFVKLGLEVEIISFDTWVTDLSWRNLDTESIAERLQAASGKLVAPMIGREGTELYIQAYLDYIKAGGKLSVQPFPSKSLMIDLLQDGPLMTTVSYDVLHGQGKHVNDGGLASHLDDILGTAPNHNIIISRQVAGMFEIYDPWLQPGVHRVRPDQLVAAISAAQQECDNMFIVARSST